MSRRSAKRRRPGASKRGAVASDDDLGEVSSSLAPPSVPPPLSCSEAMSPRYPIVHPRQEEWAWAEVTDYLPVSSERGPSSPTLSRSLSLGIQPGFYSRPGRTITQWSDCTDLAGSFCFIDGAALVRTTFREGSR